MINSFGHHDGQKIFHNIKNKMPRMGNAARKVGAVILADSKEIIHLSVTEMAEKAQVSEATVVRFCQELGFKGYQDFKIHLSQALVLPLKRLDSSIERDDSPKTLMEKVCQTTIQTIHDTLVVIEEDALRKAIELLANANRVQLFGCGRSGIVARDAENRFLKIGLWARAFSDSHNAAQACSVLSAKDVLLIFSYSGTTRDILKVAELARNNNVNIIAITRYAKTPLSRLSNVNLWTSSPETRYRSDGVSSRVAQLCIIDALFTGLFVSYSDRFAGAAQQTSTALADFRL